MEANYYTRIDGDLAGPYAVRELVRRGLGRDTPIFDDETNGYVPATAVRKLARVIRLLDRVREARGSVDGAGQFLVARRRGRPGRHEEVDATDHLRQERP
jgi:hypothetical protein